MNAYNRLYFLSTSGMLMVLMVIMGMLIGKPCEAQISLVNNQGVSIYLKPGAYVIINNDSLHNYSGVIENAGQLRVAGDIINDGMLTGNPIGATGLYDIGGNWINNGSVISYQDSVLLNGDANGSSGSLGNQFIMGLNATQFHHLILAGTPGSIKTQLVNASVTGILDLRNHELATNQFEMKIENPSLVAITKSGGSSGYVSSLDTGRLTRVTALSNDYWFPVGTPSSLVALGESFYYRPVLINPITGNSNEYSVRLVNNPTGDGYDVAAISDSLELVNALFYHRIYHGQGSDPATITLCFMPSDGSWTDIARHTGSLWTSTKLATLGTGFGPTAGFSTLSITDWSNFTRYPFALATRPLINESVNVYIPNAFSPNGDGNNDAFMAYTSNDKGLVYFELLVFNRWGEIVFESNTISQGWDGTYKGQLQNPDVYVYQATYGFRGEPLGKISKGSITLIR
ncbi:MAG: gliding motility-associated C-terminal domain-containing protein [bacterium]